MTFNKHWQSYCVSVMLKNRKREKKYFLVTIASQKPWPYLLFLDFRALWIWIEFLCVLKKYLMINKCIISYHKFKINEIRTIDFLETKMLLSTFYKHSQYEIITYYCNDTIEYLTCILFSKFIDPFSFWWRNRSRNDLSLHDGNTKKQLYR